MNFAETLIENAFIVTDGKSVKGTVLDATVAEYLCRKSHESGEILFKVANIESAIDYAYRRGFQDGSASGEMNEENPQLRDDSVSR